MKKTLKVLVAAGLSVGVTSVAFASQLCEAPIPDTIRCRNANSTLQALPSAFDTSANFNLPPGRHFSHQVKFEAGTTVAFGNILDSNGDIVHTCLRASDTTLDSFFGQDKQCDLPTPLLGARYRVSIN